MPLDSPAYDASLAAALAVCEQLYPDRSRDPLLVGKLTFIILPVLRASFDRPARNRRRKPKYLRSRR